MGWGRNLAVRRTSLRGGFLLQVAWKFLASGRRMERRRPATAGQGSLVGGDSGTMRPLFLLTRTVGLAKEGLQLFERHVCCSAIQARHPEPPSSRAGLPMFQIPIVTCSSWTFCPWPISGGCISSPRALHIPCFVLLPEAPLGRQRIQIIASL